MKMVPRWDSTYDSGSDVNWVMIKITHSVMSIALGCATFV